MIPFLESAGGNCQEAAILVELNTIMVKFLGAFDGTEIKNSRPAITSLRVSFE